MPAAPWPVPTHIVTMPYFRLWRLQRVHHRRRADGTGGAQRVAEGDRAAHRVHLGSGRGRGVEHGQRLRGKGFVQLDPVDVLVLQAGVLQRGGNRLDRADAHDLGRHAAAAKLTKRASGFRPNA
jgi:hypothetical protein